MGKMTKVVHTIKTGILNIQTKHTKHAFNDIFNALNTKHRNHKTSHHNLMEELDIKVKTNFLNFHLS